MNWHKVPFEIRTPMFIGSGGPQQAGHQLPAEFRVASLRGALRFWFRFLAGALVGSDIQTLHRLESLFFGSTDQSSRLQFRLSSPVRCGFEARPSWLTPRSRGRGSVDLTYLLGQGLWHFRSGLTRSHLPVGRRGMIEVRSRCEGKEGEADLRVLRPVLWYLQTFGGIGARVRRTFGGITFSGADVGPADTSRYESVFDDFENSVLAHPRLREFDLQRADFPDDVATYPIWDSWMFFYLEGVHRSWEDAADAAAVWLRGKRAPYRRTNDHVTNEYVDVVVPYWARKLPPHTHYDLAAMGLPANFYSKASGRQATVSPGDDYRRPSMLWLRTVQRDDGHAVMLQLFDTLVLPTQAELHIKAAREHSVRLDWSQQDAIDRIRP